MDFQDLKNVSNIIFITSVFRKLFTNHMHLSANSENIQKYKWEMLVKFDDQLQYNNDECAKSFRGAVHSTNN